MPEFGREHLAVIFLYVPYSLDSGPQQKCGGPRASSTHHIISYDFFSGQNLLAINLLHGCFTISNKYHAV
jgi:hypothetical protein